MNVAVIGAGYVGMATTLALASEDNQITLIEPGILDRYKMLKDGKCPLNEDGMQHRFDEVKDFIKIKKSIPVKVKDFDIIFVCVGTPHTESGDLDLSFIENVLHDLSRNDYKGLVVIKSTLNLGNTELLAAQYGLNLAFSPEFLRESTALRDAMNPDRIVLGLSSRIPEESRNDFYNLIKKFYREGLEGAAYRNCRFIFMNAISAELVKLAANSYLAVRLTYFNELSMLCENIGANIDDVMWGMVNDPRIGMNYATTSIGYAGPCLPKDTQSLAKYANKYRAPLRTLEGTMCSNGELFLRWIKFIDDLSRKNDCKSVLFLGVAFKDYSDDTRTSLSLKLVGRMALRGYETLHIYDPRCDENPELSENYDLIIVSSKEYADKLDEFNPKVIVDLRHCVDREKYPNVQYLGK